MSRLTKGMFDAADPRTSLFGLRTGVYKAPDDFVKNAGWYNAAGERLGWGDLSLENLRRIADELEADELFVVLKERDSYRDFYKLSPTFGDQDIKAPGSRYVAEFCVLIVARGAIYAILPKMQNRQVWSLSVLDPLARVAMKGGVKTVVINRKGARKMILGHDGTHLGRAVYRLKKRLGRN